MKNNKTIILDIADIKWGDEPAPLLPLSLRNAWNDEKLPEWVCEELLLEPNSTYSYLSSEIWRNVSKISPRLKHHLEFMLRTNLQKIRQLKCFNQVWPTGLRIKDIGWNVRTANRVIGGKANIEETYLPDLKFSEILNIEGMGVRSILDFTATLEGAINYYNELVTNCGRQNDDSCDFVKILKRIGSCEWADEICGDDPRFSSLMLGKDGTLGERIEEVLSEPDSLEKIADMPALVQSSLLAEKTIQAIDLLSLEEQLVQFLKLVSKTKAERLNAISARFGWGGEKPLTLEACGTILDVTRERIRQIQNNIIKKFPANLPYMPKLDEALALLEKNSPLTVPAAIKLLLDNKITKVSFHPESVLQAAELLRRPSTLRIVEIRGRKTVAADKDMQIVLLIPTFARKLAGQSGVSNIFQIMRMLQDKGYEANEDTVIRALKSQKQFEFLDDDWFWATDIKNTRNRLYNISRKLLSIVQPIGLQTLRDGVSRNFRWRASTSGRYKTLLVPPTKILEQYYKRHPDFIVENREVSFSKRLDYRQELGETDRVITEALRTTPTNLLNRKALAEYCISHGINENTFTVYTTYSPILEHVDIDIWKLRGVRVDPGSITAMREANHLKHREKRVMEHGWTEDGKIWIAVRVPFLSGQMVVGCPSGFLRFLTGNSYPCYSKEDATLCGAITVDEKGTMYGFGTYVRQFGVDEGDILSIEVDITEETVYLETVGEEVLDDELS